MQGGSRMTQFVTLRVRLIDMNRIAFILAAVLAVGLLPGQAPTPQPALVSPAPKKSSSTRVKPKAKAPVKYLGPTTLGASRIHYADNHDDFIYRFDEDGTFDLNWVHKMGTDPGHKEGKFTFKRTGAKTATLAIDDATWTMTFDQANRATCTSEGDARTLVFFWEK